MPDAVITKPGIDETESEFRVRLRNPDDFQSDTFRTIPIKRDKPRVFGIVGRLQGETNTTLQALRFPKEDGWTRGSVREWMDAHPDIGKSAPIDDEEMTNPVATAVIDRLHRILEKEPAADEVVHKAYRPSVIKAVDPEKHEVEVTISTRSIDRDREVVLPSGMRVKPPKRIPLMASHDYRELHKQIGEVVRIRPEEETIWARIRYLVGRGNEEADWAWVLVSEGLAAYSIGFIPTKWEDADLSDEKVVQQILAGKKPIRTYTEWELVETSQVSVPSNRDAVQHAVSKGLFTPKEGENILALFEEKIEDKPDPPKPSPPAPNPPLPNLQPLAPKPGVPEPGERNTASVALEIVEKNQDDVLDLLEGMETKAAWKIGGSRGLPLSDDESWDASAARSSLGDDLAVWKRAHIVYDADDPDQKGSYKLPFARREGGALKASKSGLQAARQRLSATEIPPNVRAAAGRFIDSYLGPQEEREATLRFVRDDPDAPDRIEVRDTSDILVYSGNVAGLSELILHAAEPKDVNVTVAPVTIDAANIKAVLETWATGFIEQLKSSLAEHAKAIPTFPADSAAFTSVKDLLEAVHAHVECVARSIAAAEIAKATGNVDAYRR